MTIKHSPGPWRCEDGLILPKDEQYTIASVNLGISARVRGYYEGNCRLIESAPDLLSALRQCIDALEYAAYNYDGAKLADLPPGIMESTGVSDTCLIAVRDAISVIHKATTP
jgi:hypothetical protein